MNTPRPLLAGLLLALALTTTAGCAKTAAPASAPAALSAELEAERAYGIETVMGIGPTYGAKLKEADITNTKKLLEATSTRYKRQKLAEATGIPYKLVLQWAQKVAIMGIAGIGPRQSNLLAAVGIDSVQDLARRDPANLWERVGVANAFEPKFVSGTPSLATITRWVSDAKKLAKQTDSEE